MLYFMQILHEYTRFMRKNIFERLEFLKKF